MVPWTVVFVKRGSLEMSQRKVVAPTDTKDAWTHVTGLIDDGWLLCMTKGSHEMVLGQVPVGRDALSGLRQSSSKQVGLFATKPEAARWLEEDDS